MREGLRHGVVLLALLGLMTACGGGGGGQGPTAPPPPAPVSFTSSGGGANSLSLAQGAGTTANLLVLELRADQVTDLYGIAFDLTYPAGLLSFSGGRQGAFFAQGGAATTFQVGEASAGRLVVGASRLGGVAGAGGSGVVLSLDFTVLANGSGGISFSENQAFDPAGVAMGGIAWNGGSVQINR